MRPIHIRILFGPQVCTNARFQALGRKRFIDIGKNVVRLSQRSRKIQCRRCRFPENIAFLRSIRFCRSHKAIPTVRRHLEKNAAIVILHPQEKFQFKTNLVQQTRRLFKRSGKTRTADKCRILAQFASKHQCCDTHAAIHDVLAIITGIVPATMSVPKSCTVHCRMELQLIIQMRSRTCPSPSKLFRQIHTAPLIIERLDIRPNFTRKPFIRDFKQMRFSIEIGQRNLVLPRFSHC